MFAWLYIEHDIPDVYVSYDCEPHDGWGGADTSAETQCRVLMIMA